MNGFENFNPEDIEMNTLERLNTYDIAKLTIPKKKKLMPYHFSKLLKFQVMAKKIWHKDQISGRTLPYIQFSCK
jgi:hypothetical protein